MAQQETAEQGAPFGGESWLYAGNAQGPGRLRGTVEHCGSHAPAALDKESGIDCVSRGAGSFDPLADPVRSVLRAVMLLEACAGKVPFGGFRREEGEDGQAG